MSLKSAAFHAIAWALALLTCSLGEAKGGWVSGGGGGTGVACFNDETTARSFDPVLQNYNLLTDEKIAQIRSLVTLEAWDIQGNLALQTQYASMEQALATVHRKISDTSPILAFRLNQLRPSISIDTWKSRAEENSLFINTDDAQPQRTLTPNCRLIQLAVRYTDIPASAKEIPRKIPKIKVLFEPRLFARLQPHDQAILLAHEELYLMARSLGHPNSDLIRKLVGYFFSETFLNKPSDHRFRTQVQAWAVELLGDYMLYFADEPLPKPFDVPREKAPPYSQLSRYHSFLSALHKVRSEIHECSKTSDDNKACKDKVMHPDHQVGILNEEEVFTMFARLILDRRRENMRSSEYLVIPFTDKDQLTLAARNMLDACTGAFDNRIDLVGTPLERFVDKALNYCMGAIRAHAFGVFYDLKNTLPTLAVQDENSYLNFQPSTSVLAPAKPFTQAARAIAYDKAMLEIRERIGKCRKAPPRGLSTADCVRYENSPARLAGWVSDEQAFLLYTHFEMDDGQPGPRPPSTVLREPDPPTLIHKSLRSACEQAFDSRIEASGLPNMEPFFEKVLNYCLDAIRSHGEGIEQP